MIIERSVIESILAAGAQAPSGSNSQPWRFEVLNNVITVIALPEKDHPVLNVAYRGTWLAHGALTENISIAANHAGYRAMMKFFPDSSRPNVTAEITLELEQERKDDSLYAPIFSRSTNRKSFENTSLTSDVQEKIIHAGDEIPGVSVAWVEDRDARTRLGEASSINEILMLEDENLHRLFFNEIVWNKQEESKRGGGLLASTMELKPPEKFALRFLFQNWWIMRILVKIGIPRFIAKENAKTYATGSCMGAIIIKDNDKDFLQAGRAMERIWLMAERYSLSFQLITGTLFLMHGMRTGAFKTEQVEHVNLIKKGYNSIASAFKVQEGIVAVMFRIGKASKPSEQSLKLPPQITFINTA